MSYEKNLLPYKKLLDNSSDSILLLDKDGQIIDVNKTFVMNIGFQLDEIRKQTLNILNLDLNKQDFYNHFWEEAVNSNHWTGKVWIKDKFGDILTVFLKLNQFKDNGNTFYAVILNKDSFDSNLAEEKNQGYYDPLTKLPNKMKFEEGLSKKLSFLNKNTHNEQAAVLCLDLNNFKLINENLGFHVGDDLLKIAGKRLRTLSKEYEMNIGRLNGDEFVLFMKDIEGKVEIAKIAEKILKSIARPVQVDNHELYVTASIGISVYPTDGQSAKSLIKNADLARHTSKQRAKNSYKFYESQMNSNFYKELFLENNIQSAIEDNQFILEYQPQLDLKTNKIVGMEALVRWNHPRLGRIPPNVFIPMAEKYGFIIPISKWVMEQACRDNKLLQDKGFDPITVSINISPWQFQQDNFLELIENTLKETGLDKNYFGIEITESMSIHNIDVVISILNKLRELNIKVSMDDFGTGYSSLSYLSQLPIDVLKIDRSFISHINKDKNRSAITSAILAMSHNLGLEVVAEGVESEDDIEFLRAKNCEEVQGYHISKPVNIEEFIKMLQKYNVKKSR